MTSRSPRSEVGENFPLHPLRSASFSSDVMSSSTRSTGAAPIVPHANPPPAYVAASEASDLISIELGRKVHIAPAALTLLNEFLDHVLYSILCTSHSVSLGQLKAAVPVVLKPRLGKSALKVAEEELKDYIEDEEAEELYSNKNNLQPKTVFDTDLVWKLTRLRCMVYARMGDLEEEDEEEWLENEGLLDQAAAFSNASRSSMAVAPGAAIFLTSIVEYLGEQALYYAAQYAQKRHNAAQRASSATNALEAQIPTRNSEILLEGKDMNHVGRDSPLSRLWRSWRRNTRSAGDLASRPMSPDDAIPPPMASLLNQTSSISAHQPSAPGTGQRRMSNNSVIAASRIPLPISENDVGEIEGHNSLTNGVHFEKGSRRPSSMPTMTGKSSENVPTTSPTTPSFQERSPLRPKTDRSRSNSLPAGEKFLMSDRGEILAGHKANAEELGNGSALTEAKDKPSAGQNLTPSPVQAIPTVGVIAGALDVVGVHHVQQRQILQPLEVNTTNVHSGGRSKGPSEPLTSASITAPGDFDMMYVPEGRVSPEELKTKPLDKTPPPQIPTKEEDAYQRLAAQQLEEHQRYSQQSRDMQTPSIYTNHEHSPRFPRDTSTFPATASDVPSAQIETTEKNIPDPSLKREIGKAASHHATTRAPIEAAEPSAPTPETRRPKSSHAISPEAGRAATPQAPSSYAPTPEPGIIYDENGNYVYGAASSGANQTWQQQAESPVSQMSGKHPFRRHPPPDESVPEVPEIPKMRMPQQASLNEGTAAYAGGHSKSSSSSSRLLGFTRDVSGRPHSIYQQSATGGMSDQERRAHSSTPDSRRELQNMDQAASSPKRQHLRIRADSDNNITRISANSLDRHRSLEHLINSDDTLHYTLTPATAEFREEDINPSSKRTQTQDLADFLRNTAPPGQENTKTPSSRSRKTSFNATRAPQVLPVTRGPIHSSKDITASTMSKPKIKNPMGEPRDAKVDRMSGVRDLAEYARSTGPSTADQLPRPLGGNVMIHQNRPVEMAAPNSPVDRSSKASSRPQNRLRFQARDPRPSRHAESTDLVDFIREGPPNSTGGERSELQTASLRTTTTSDNTNNRISQQTQESSETNGIRSTTDSQTPLLDHDDKPDATMAPSFAQQISKAEPKSKVLDKDRRKVKDPYPLEDDDDDDAISDIRPSKPKKEESLIDFLRNTEPTPNSIAQPILASTTKSPPANTPAKNNIAATKQSDSQTRARAESPHLTQTGSKLDSYRPTQATHASHIDRNRNKPKVRNINDNGNTVSRNVNGTTTTMKAFGANSSDTHLADYLKSTRPSSMQAGWTEPLVNRSVNGVKAEGGGGLRKFFSIKRK